MFDSAVPGLRAKRIQVFICCFMQYAMLHSCRSTWSFTSGILAKQDDHEHDDEKIDDFDKKYLGYINFSFLFVYGSSMLFLGQIGDRIGPKLFMLCGTFSTGIVQFMIAALLPVEKHNRWLLLVLQILNGVSQAPAWPGLMAIMNNWQSKPNKVIVMGYFAACTNVGNILGDLFAALLIEQLGMSVMAPIYVSAIGVLIMSVINIYMIEASSAKEYIAQFKNPLTKSLVYKQAHDEYMSRAASVVSVSEQSFVTDLSQTLMTVDRDSQMNPYVPPKPKKNKKDSINMISAWKLPNVALYALAFGCIKAVFYILAFWLPSYLKGQNLEGVAWITQMIEWGTIPGGILIWYYTVIILVMQESIGIQGLVLLCLHCGINFLSKLEQPYALYYILVFLTGLMIGGVYNNVSGAIVIELSNMKELKGNKKSTATVTSVVMGYGAVFAAINQLIVPYLESILFLYCSLNAIVAGCFLIPLIINEYKRHKEQKLKVAIGQ
ncbi:unnamed protein product (macronuclear) [Paramecium tetraurelia]|uniref:Major facilitator superfamily (MFS) profile domain-containing protein n=1 Tax=Paramecium tetraurelia TaxID=5888 RepID=A0CD88_PARTE|nr:uncharacterized protein GSPATT00006966001 [Paramecium tetraurelia]CAK68755.1 unnamed protein product [Paramecium tetraurelia]|eukprot:XP_001436152.1 hypothetical protein (macronuclear) [Paramecium tetraurelia strain d4-2]